MTKADFVDKIAAKVEGITKAKAEESLNAIVDILREAMEAGDSVVLTGFGTFKVVERSERKGHNPQTHEEITIPARKVCKFTPGKVLKDSLK